MKRKLVSLLYLCSSGRALNMDISALSLPCGDVGWFLVTP